MPRPWTPEDVPAGPYYHGSSWAYDEGQTIPTDVVHPEADHTGAVDDRQMSWATTSEEMAFAYACGNGLHLAERETLYVYEVEMTDPEVDINVHGSFCWVEGQVLHSLMAPEVRVARIHSTRSVSGCKLDPACKACFPEDTGA
jgi:hypothetical protein